MGNLIKFLKSNIVLILIILFFIVPNFLSTFTLQIPLAYRRVGSSDMV